MNKAVLFGNGITINFGGATYRNEFIIKRIVFNALANKYDSLFAGTITGTEIAQVFYGLTDWVQKIVSGKCDFSIDESESDTLEDFKARYKRIPSHYYEVALEDWMFILYVFFKESKDDGAWLSAKEGFRWMMLDAIYNDGEIQLLYTRMGRSVKRWIKRFDTVLTLNYDNNIEKLIKQPIYHLHGDFETPGDNENIDTILGIVRFQGGQSVTVPQFEHCFCNAILDYSGRNKLHTITIHEKGEQGFANLSNQKTESVEPLSPVFEKYMKVHDDNPELPFLTTYHYDKLRSLSGELHIVGMSPNNDSHIFETINNSNIDKVVYYYYSEDEKSGELSIQKPVEYKSVKELWESLDAVPKQYYYNYSWPQLEKARDFIEIIKVLSGDSVTDTQIIDNANSIPQFMIDKLCEEIGQVLLEEKEIGPPKTGDELKSQLAKISKIALRNGVLPSALLLHFIRTKRFANLF